LGQSEILIVSTEPGAGTRTGEAEVAALVSRSRRVQRRQHASKADAYSCHDEKQDRRGRQQSDAEEQGERGPKDGKKNIEPWRCGRNAVSHCGSLEKTRGGMKA
jgi:hypothetical protein